ncbi:MAG: DNA-processing protein DprA [Acidimicrobiales bacterium]
MVTAIDERAAHVAALAGLPGMTPVRLTRLLDGFSPKVAWEMVRAGAHPGDRKRRFLRGAEDVEVAAVASRYATAGVEVLTTETPGYPASLLGDPGAPAVLFCKGDPRVVDRRSRVAIVGTRSPTPYGRSVAAELARDLAFEGVSIVSGLALGIDAAAHAGVVRTHRAGSAPPIAVVGTGLDVIYPASNRGLWEDVAAAGAVFSESPLGTRPHPGVFPARNRIIAGLSHVVVIVESHARGGSFYTVDAAARRSIPVCAVPGSVRSRASEGTNALLADGCVPVRDAVDVLTALELARTGRERTAPGVRARSGGSRRGPDRGAGDAGGPVTPEERAVLAVVGDLPVAFETVLLATGLPIAAASEACDQLLDRGVLGTGGGWWWSGGRRGLRGPAR